MAPRIALILAVPATYSVCAASALRVITTNREDTWSAEAMMDVAELFSAVALFAFQRLLVIYVDSSSTSAGESDKGIRRGFQRLISMGIRQYVVLAFGFNSLLVVVKAWDWLYPSSCERGLEFMAKLWFPRHSIVLHPGATLDHSLHTRTASLACEDVWNSVSLLMVVADFFTCSIALFAVFQYERTFSILLRSVNPFWKFWGVKGLLSVNFLQSTVLTVLGVLMGDKVLGDFRTLLNYYLICVEACLLAVLNLFAYPPQHPDWIRVQEENAALGITWGDEENSTRGAELDLQAADSDGSNRSNGAIVIGKASVEGI
eukprot:TRINITY_DN83072_c0_g1_i1.p1 TRINITY_DN83072_c0_g1~~TRINITY_DN83072_c0_g1_i1.p1  ORF type:complete len:368 (+),score=73.57 TRINITY_DN83072_c0_g1_i1:155-1105(+)